MSHHIAVIGGDGIGPEVTREALKVVRASGVAFVATEFDLGGAQYLKDGEILSDSLTVGATDPSRAIDAESVASWERSLSPKQVDDVLAVAGHPGPARGIG